MKLPHNVLPLPLLCIGYPDENPPITPRLPLEAVLHENEYKMSSSKLLKDHYEKAYKSLSNPRISWAFNFTPERVKELEKLARHDLELGLEL